MVFAGVFGGGLNRVSSNLGFLPDRVLVRWPLRGVIFGLPFAIVG